MTVEASERPYSALERHLSVIEGAGRSGARGLKASMVTWQAAHQIAHMAAAQTHARLGAELSGVSVDVTAAIREAGVALMWQPMPTMFGAYLNEDGGRPGILINSGLPRGARRYTAAHELGHHALGHVTTVDDGSTIDTVLREEVDAIPIRRRRRDWPDQEKYAEAFASWFLMPRQVVRNALSRLGLERPRTDLDVYRLSLLLGTSYRTTVRHLANLKLAHQSNLSAWSRTAPSRIKAMLDADFNPPPSRVPDVWLIEATFDGLAIDLQPGDRVVVDAQTHGLSAPEWLRPIEPAAMSGGLAMFEADFLPESPEGTVLSGKLGTRAWTVGVTVARRPRGLDPRTLG